MKYHENNQINLFIKKQISKSDLQQHEISDFVSKNQDLISEEELTDLIHENKISEPIKHEVSEKLLSDFEEVIENSLSNGYIEFYEIKEFTENGMSIEDIIAEFSIQILKF